MPYRSWPSNWYGTIGITLALTFCACADDGGDDPSSEDGGHEDAAQAEDAATEEDAGARPDASEAGDASDDAGDAALGDASEDGGSEPLPGEWLPPESGTRLIARTLGEPGSSTRAFVTFYDQELEVECTFERASDGSLRCMPISGDHFIVDFLSDDCTDPLYRVGSCASTPMWSRTYIGGGPGCPALSSHLLVEAEDPQVRYWEEADPETGEVYCTESSPPEPPAVAEYVDGAALALDAMVEAAATELAIEGELRLLLLEASDGARLTLPLVPKADLCAPSGQSVDTTSLSRALSGSGSVQVPFFATADGTLLQPEPSADGHDPLFFDVARDAVCVAKLTVDGDYRCLPESTVAIGEASTFADADCEQVLISVDIGAERPLGALFDHDPCAGSHDGRRISSLLEPGELHTGLVYYDNGTECVEVDFSGEDHYLAGEDVLGDYPRLVIE